MRKNLKLFRVSHGLTQKDMAEKTGLSRTGYGFIEKGRTQGSPTFWNALQREFNVPDEDMYKLMKLEEGNEYKK